MQLSETRACGNGTIRAFASPAFSAALLAWLPKCPACLILLLAPLGIRLPASNLLLTGAAIAALIVPIALFRARVCNRCAILPSCLAVLGIGLMAAGRFTEAGPLLLFAGASCVFSASLWSSYLRQPRVR